MGYASKINEQGKTLTMQEEVSADKQQFQDIVSKAEKMARLKHYPEWEVMEDLLKDVYAKAEYEMLSDKKIGTQGELKTPIDREIAVQTFKNTKILVKEVENIIERGNMAIKGIEEIDAKPEEYYRKKHERN